LKKAGSDLKGRDFSKLMSAPNEANPNSLRPASLFNYNMLSFQDAKWAKKMDDYMKDSDSPLAAKIKTLMKDEPDFYNRCAIRSVFDGRYRFSRYFAPMVFNTPTAFEALTANNDLELYDLQEDPEEINNLAASGSNTELLMAMNDKLNVRIAEEVGIDDGSFLPLRNGKWHFPDAAERGALEPGQQDRELRSVQS
jgi:hypothetical protein